jgi:uncharacterized protein YndB with AHSA1/START domain
VSVDVVLDVPAEQVWSRVVDWPGQRDWMVATTMRVVGDRTEGLGTRLEAVTGAGPAALVDPMVVTDWEPPNRCVLRHTGALVRGQGVFEVFALPGDRSRFVWREELDLPLGTLGRAGWPVVRPAVVAGMRTCLRRLQRLLAQGRTT